MSRIGNQAIEIPSAVTVTINGTDVAVKGPKGELKMTLPPGISVATEDNKIVVTRPNDTREAKAMHGLGRSLVNNMVIGVTEGYEKKLEIIGVGYKAAVKGKVLDLALGFSHPTTFDIPEGIEIKVDANTKISVSGIDKQKVGQAAATIRKFKKPEPYKGKGVRYLGEYVAIKEGKSVG